jgi:hypothetical protein
VKLLRKRLAWLLARETLLYRMKELEAQMDFWMAKATDTFSDKGGMQEESQQGYDMAMEIFWRLYERHEEMEGLCTYLGGDLFRLKFFSRGYLKAIMFELSGEE